MTDENTAAESTETTPTPTPAIAYVGNICPPMTDRTTPTVPAALWRRAKWLILTTLGGLLVFGVIYGIGSVLDWSKLMRASYFAGGFIALVGLWMAVTMRQGTCPFCQAHIKEMGFDELLCPHCHELLSLDKKQLRPLNKHTEHDEDRALLAPMVHALEWPDECIACGSPATRYEDVSETGVELSQLLIGSLSTSSAKAGGIPYCDNHSKAVTLKIDDEKAYFVFEDHAAQRRYASLNVGKTVLKSK